MEAAVKPAKTHLLKVVGNINLTCEDLLVLLAQFEMFFDPRPMTPIPEDSSDLEMSL